MSKPKIPPLEFEKPIVELERMLAELQIRSQASEVNLSPEVSQIQARLEQTRRQIYANLTPWQKVQIVRHIQRPYFLDYMGLLAEDFIELSGDRVFGNDRAIVGGLATIGGHKVMVLGQQKGRDTKENLLRNFGSPHPEGYRKAMRLMRMADKFKLPICCFIDTPGAYPGVGSEERHVGEAIAVNLRDMFELRVPIIATVLGEGGSGGALGIGIGDRVLLLENAYYSVISPEGCAAILWKNRSFAPQAAEALKMTARDLLELGLVDEIVPEPEGGAHHDSALAASNLKSVLIRSLEELETQDVTTLLDARYEKFRRFGHFLENIEAEVAA
jgi:acetyl-CoA carboxylase carboxyl transferase subunit alpha